MKRQKIHSIVERFGVRKILPQRSSALFGWGLTRRRYVDRIVRRNGRLSSAQADLLPQTASASVSKSPPKIKQESALDRFEANAIFVLQRLESSDIFG